MKDGVCFLKDFEVTIWNGKRMVAHPIQESFFYRALVENNSKLYNEYADLVHSSYPSMLRGQRQKIISFKAFVAILMDIRDNGWRRIPLRIVDGRKGGLEILDGQHRASILLFLDEDVKIHVRVSGEAQPIPTGVIKFAKGVKE
jgi:hypothetical protein